MNFSILDNGVSYGTIAGTRSAIDQLLDRLKSDPRPADLDHKESYNKTNPFSRTKGIHDQWTGTRFQERERQIQLARERNETHIGGEMAKLQESRREQKRVRKQATGIVNLRA